MQSDTSQRRPGLLVDSGDPQTQARDGGKSCSTPRALGQSPEATETADPPHGPSLRARVAREGWWTPQALGRKCEAPRTAGRPRRLSDPGPSRLGVLVDPVGLQIRAGVAWGLWSNPRGLWDSPKFPRTAGPPRGPSGTGPSCPGYLVDTVVRLTRARVARDSWSTHQDTGHGPKLPRTAGRPRSLGPKLILPGRVGRQRGTRGTSRSHPGQLVDPKSLWTRGPVAKERWSIPRAINTRAGVPVQLVNTAGPRSQARVPGTAGRPYGASGTVPSLPADEVEIGRASCRERV